MIIRIKYQKHGSARFLSQLEVQSIWHRALRRADLPVALTKGFNPHYKISFGPALPVGVASDGEYLDVELNREVEIHNFKDEMSTYLPEGMEITKVVKISVKPESLMAIINRAEYFITQRILECPDNLSVILEDFLQQKNIVVNRKTKSKIKQIDIRPGIFELTAECENNILILNTILQTGSEGNIKPQEVLTSFMEFAELVSTSQEKITRKNLYIQRGKNLITPLEVLEG